MATNGLSRWEMLTKVKPGRVYSRSQRVASNGDIQDWIKKVQAASERVASVEAVESMYAESQKYSSFLADVAKKKEDSAVLEAQQLIDQYLQKKLDSDDEYHSDSDTSDKVYSKTKTGSKSLWSLLDEVDENGFGGNRYGILTNFRKNNDPFKILEKDNSELVDSIVEDLLQKDFVSDGVVKKMVHKDELTGVDPRTKMTLRHAQVKENREKRRQEKEKKLRELQQTREVQLKARQTIMKEEKEKELQARREEMELQKEMARLRKELEEDRKKQEQERQKKLKEEEELQKRAREEFKKELAKEQEQERLELLKANVKREKILTRMAEIEKKQAKENLKLKRRFFSAWYGVILERRIHLGKAKATADWKLIFRIFTAWKNLTIGKKMDEEASRHALLVREMHRKDLKAVDHFRTRMLRKAFSTWTLFISQEQNLRLQEQAQNQTKGKMAAFLEAAASGRLWTDCSKGQASTVRPGQNEKKPASLAEMMGSSSLVRQRRQSVGSTSAKSPHSSARSEELVPQPNGQSSKVKRPTEPWQVTRKHIQLVDELNLETSPQRHNKVFSRNNDRGQASSRYGQSNETGSNQLNVAGKLVRPRSAFAVNNYEHRHQAQQKILEMQQNQLKEQQRLIEELQYLQHQQMLHQQLTQQHLMKVQLGGRIPGGGASAKEDGVTETDLKNLQTHIEKMRNELVKSGFKFEVERDERTEQPSSNRVERDSTQTTGRSETTASSRMSKPSENPKHLKFLNAMQERAAERERLKKEREERKRKQEEERLLQLKAEAEEKQHLEEEEKRKKIREAKEKKEQERQNLLRQKEETERMRQLMALAEEHHKRALVRFRGFMPWKKLIDDFRSRRDLAVLRYNLNIQRKVLLSWRTTIQEDLKEKQAKADSMNHYLLVRRCLTAWKRCKNYSAILEEKADRHYDRRLLQRILSAWADYNTERKIQEWHLERKAEEFHSMSVVRIAFRAWKRFPSMKKEEEAKQKRLEEMRKKISAIIPDFRPPSTNLTLTSME